MPTVLQKKNLFYPANCKIEKCVDQFKVALPTSSKFLDKLSWDDIISAIFFLFNFSILILTTINIVDQFNKKLDEKQKNDILLSQKILRIVLAIVTILIGFYHLYIYYSVVEYSIQNRAFMAGTQMFTGILFLVFSFFSFSPDKQ